MSEKQVEQSKVRLRYLFGPRTSILTSPLLFQPSQDRLKEMLAIEELK